MHSLADKTAVVTGSTSGIGHAIAKAFAEAGTHVMLNGLGTREENAEAIAEIEQAAAGGARVSFAPTNMAKPDEIPSLIEQTRDELGPVDILVNNAGVQHVSKIEEFPLEKWDLILAVNLSSAFHTTRAVMAEMKERGWGRIINTASAHSLVASPYKAAYVTAKHGIAGLTKVVALEGAEYGITCNAISPGYVWTPLVENQLADTATTRGISEEEVKNDVMLKPQPTKQFVKTEEIGAMAVFLCSDAAANVTGANMTIDGGWTAQ
ncbi:MAG: 3-hydroxybutyrate dehydrogenase [Pseudomonadota bacterium]